MTSLQDELSRTMDRLTQLQNGIDSLVTIMYSSINYLHRQSTFEQVSPDIPVTQNIPNRDDPATFEANCKELVEDFIRKSKQIEHLISILPQSSPPPEADDDGDFAELEADLQAANKEYEDALKVAESLREEMRKALRRILEERQTALAQPVAVD